MNRRPPRNGEKIAKIQNTLLVDGNFLFKTGFFASKDSYNIRGEHIGGISAFLYMLRKLLMDDMYHRVYVFWDGNFSGKMRYEIYKPYKSSRGKDYENGTQPIDESELQQRKMIWDYLNELNIRQLKHEIIEGDDFIAYYCLTKKENEKITICTNDRDMCQLISEDVRIYFLDLKNYVGKSNFNEYFCYHKENAALVKIMTGDSSDCIKGIKGLGVKTLLTNFPEIAERKMTVEEIVEKAKLLQEEKKKIKKPLKVLDNIINRVTEGVQGTRIYEINELLVNLKKPMMTDDAIEDLETLIDTPLETSERDIKNVLRYMERDGMDKIIGDYRYADYLTPFNKLKEREKNNFLNK